MNKTININLGGIFFHIDEIAFQKLKRYLDAIRRSLSDDPQGRDEIITDIEARISELLSEKIKDPRQVVSESDIDEVIAVMGQPEDYMVDEELFTDESGKTYSRKSSQKKLFRDTDDKFLGGVSSGIAHYFDIDVIWVRIAWIIAVVAGFGTGIIVYIILWILLPEARTTAEKLQMQGEPVTISNIEKKIRAEFEDVSERVKDAAGDVKDAVKEGYTNVSDAVKKKDLKKHSERAKSGLQDLIETLGKIIVAFFMVIGKLIGVLLIIVSVTALVGLVVGLFTAGTVDFIGADWMFDEGFQMINPTGIPMWVVSLIILVLVGIPFLMLFFLGLFILSSKAKILSRTAKFVLLGIWIIALLAAIFIGLKQASEFAFEGSSIEQHEIMVNPIDTITIKMIDDETISNYTTLRRRHSFVKVYDQNDEEKFYSNNIRLSIRKSDSTEAYIKVRKESHGNSRLAARKNAEEISYGFEAMPENLILNGFFLTDSNQLFRDQELLVTLYVPLDQNIFLDESLYSFMYYSKNTLDMYHGDMPDHYFKMTDDGMECLDCDEEVWKVEEDDENKDGVKVNVDEDGLEIKINDDGEKAEVKIDENGLKIK